MGKIKGKVISPGDKGMIVLKGETEQIPYEQVYSLELGIAEGTAVTLEIITVNEKKKAVCVNPIDKGEVTEIFEDGNSGTIFEKESNISYNFKQPNLKELGISRKDIVKYTLVKTKDGMMATCLTKPE